MCLEKHEKPCAWKFGVDVRLLNSLIDFPWSHHHSVDQHWRECCLLLWWAYRLRDLNGGYTGGRDRSHTFSS